jgi:hypothetical protein
MRRRKRTRREVETLKNVKKMHRKDQIINPVWFEGNQVDLASELVTAIATRPPRWGGLTLSMQKVGNPTELLLKFN